MIETIFIHCETYSRKANAAGQSVEQIIAEGLRQGDFHTHVSQPHKPLILMGDAYGFQKAHDDHISARKTDVLRGGKEISRAIRKDRHTLFTIIASFPKKVSEVSASNELTDRLKLWVRKTCKWVRKKYGEQLKVALLHIDEEYPHIHFWMLPSDPSGNAKLLHPGKRAKLEVEAQLKLEGTPPRTAVKLGNRAFKKEMRSWIDDYFLNVGLEFGFHRDGPGRRRLSAAQYQAEKSMLKTYCALRAQIAALRIEVAQLDAQKQDTIYANQRMEESSRSLELYLQSRYLELAGFEERAKLHQRKLCDISHQAAALGPMIEAAVREIENGTIYFGEQKKWIVKDPGPFLAAGKLGLRLFPVIKKLASLISSAESESAEAQNQEFQPNPLKLEVSPEYN